MFRDADIFVAPVTQAQKQGHVLYYHVSLPDMIHPMMRNLLLH